MASFGSLADQSVRRRGLRRHLVPAARTTEHGCWRTGVGAHGGPVLVAQRIRSDGKQEVVDSTLATKPGRVFSSREYLPIDLYRRGLTGGCLEIARGTRDDRCRQTPRPPSWQVAHDRSPASRAAAPPGAQDQKYPREGPARPTPTPQEHVSTPPCTPPTGIVRSTQRRPMLRRHLGGDLSCLEAVACLPSDLDNLLNCSRQHDSRLSVAIRRRPQVGKLVPPALWPSSPMSGFGDVYIGVAG